VTEDGANGRVGFKVHLSGPATRGFTAFLDPAKRTYLIDFSGPPNASQTLSKADSSVECTSEIVQFGSIRRSSPPIPGFLGFGQLSYFIVLADDMRPEYRSESLQAIDRWIANAGVDPKLTNESSFLNDPDDTSMFEQDPTFWLTVQLDAARRRLGPHFRGTIVAYGCDLSRRTVWQTRFLDLSLAT
jgi:hypothetical protein